MELRCRSRAPLLAPLLATALWAAPAVAQTADDAARAAPAERPRARVWDEAYKAARAELSRGDFAAAARDFAELARTATNAADAQLAKEQAALSADWAERGLTFVREEDVTPRIVVSDSAASAKAADVRSRDEIVSLYGSSIVYGLGTGVWLDAAIPVEGSGPAVLLPIGTAAAASVVGVAFLDSGRGLRYGVAQSIVSGMYLGLEEGVVLSAWNNSREGSHTMKPGAIATVIWGTSTAGAVAGAIVGTTVGTTPGRASWVGSTGLWTGLFVGSVAGAFNGGGNATDPLLGTALGLNVGVVGGMLSADAVSPSIARVRYLDLGGLCGVLLLDGVYLAATGDRSDARAASGLAALGMAAGLGVTWAATHDMPQDRRDRRAPTAAETPVANVSPMLTPMQGGAVLGLQGQLF